MSGDVYEVTMPKLGETVTEGVVSQWLKQPGDTIAFDDPLFEVSTDKVDSEVPSPYDGVLLEILVNEGDTVPVGTPIARIGEPGAATPTAAAPDAAAPESSEPATGPAAVPLPQAGNGQAGVPLSPVVRRLAAENDIDLSTVTGSGAGGRIRREDVEQAIAARPFPTTPAAAHAAPPGVPGPAPAAATAPSAATAPATTPPTPAAAPALAPPAAAQAPPAAAAKAASAVAPGGEVVKLSRIRLITAERMVGSRKISAHVWTSLEVDFENVERVRQRHKDQFKKSEGVSLTYLPFVARAVCDALREYPAVNSSIDIEAQTMTFHHYVNLGISVDLDQQGLMAPVVKNADALNLRGLARSMATLAAAARSRTLSPADLSGSTFTITNPGPSASYASAPVINQPNVAILATDGIARRPVAVGDAIAIHHTGILGFSYDHRAFDGSTASLFLQYIRDALQDRAWEAEFS
jgi:2-oxoglutarate dehydrogenase E2 component (dihydrolipoamide succinyltransferase)